MPNFKKFKTVICLVFIFLFILLPFENIFALELGDILTFMGGGPIGWLGYKVVTMISSSMVPTGNLITDPINNIALGIAKIIAGFIINTSQLLINLGQSILTYTINYEAGWTNPADFNSSSGKVVEAGWGIVRNVANAALIIGLVIIAINIILGREENKAKKTLINFIIIALLINFTPVICGFIIEGSNIITKSFISGGISSTGTDLVSSGFATLFNNVKDDNVMAIAAMTVIYALFALVSFFIYLLYGLLFMGRAIILWILVIVSPIAFATKVFPKSEYIKYIFPSVTYWDDWWKSFVQWCVIGIPAGMSIYLANMLVPQIANVSMDGDIGSIFTNIIALIFSCLPPFIFLIAGFFLSISAGGQVGSFVGGVATGAWAMTGGKYVNTLKEKAKQGGEWLVEGGKRTATGLAIGGLTEGIPGAYKGAFTPEGREKAVQSWEKTKEYVKWNRRGESAAKRNAEIEEEAKRMGNISKEDRQEISLKETMTRKGELQRAAAFKKSLEKGEATNAQLDYLSKNKDWAKTFGVDLKDAAKARPDYAQKLINKSAQEVINEMSPADAGKTINSASFADPQVLTSLSTQTMKGKLNKGKEEDLNKIREGFAKLLQNMNVFSGTIVLPEDLNKLVLNNVGAIGKEADKMINSGVAEEKRTGERIKELVNAQYQRKI